MVFSARFSQWQWAYRSVMPMTTDKWASQYVNCQQEHRNTPSTTPRIHSCVRAERWSNIRGASPREESLHLATLTSSSLSRAFQHVECLSGSSHDRPERDIWECNWSNERRILVRPPRNEARREQESKMQEREAGGRLLLARPPCEWFRQYGWRPAYRGWCRYAFDSLGDTKQGRSRVHRSQVHRRR